jgi:beta-galactosidase
MLKLTSEGLGAALTDPYELVAGGLFSLSGGNVTVGLQHGASFGGGGDWIGFENVDLGSVGSDRITIPLFANYNTPVRISVWDGTPENGECLGDFEYALKPVWLTYQPMTYTLSKVLRGVHTLSFKSDLSYDMQGFSFEKRQKETSELSALYAENIYGDSFTCGEDAVTGIGNNVTVDFGAFSFGAPPTKIFITGRSALPVNSIHLQSEGTESKRLLLEFEGCEEYTEREFPIDGIESECRISLFFLPGSDFDLKSVRFG